MSEIVQLPHGLAAVIITRAELKRIEKGKKRDDNQLELDEAPL